MATDLNGFSNVNPGEHGISFYLDQGYKVKAINIDFDTCDGDNVYESLSQLEQIITTINGIPYTFSVSTIEAKPTYFHYRILPHVTITSTVSTSSIYPCTPLNLIPGVEESGFVSSEYDVTINNATEIRTNSFAYDIDRTKSQVKPVNLVSILNNTATLAPVQESNYTAQGILNSRYEGTKSSIDEFGVDSMLSLGVFEGEIELIDNYDSLICSKSSDQRDLQDLFYAVSSYYVPNNWLPNGMPTDSRNLNKPNVRFSHAFESSLYLQSTGFSSITGITIQTITTEFQISGSRMGRIFPGDYLYCWNNSSSPLRTEFVQVLDRSYDATTKVMTYNVKRDAFAEYGYPQTLDFSASSSDKWVLLHVVGDIIYATDDTSTNTVYKIKSKKIYNDETNEIFLVDNQGRLVKRTTTCSIVAEQP